MNSKNVNFNPWVSTKRFECAELKLGFQIFRIVWSVLLQLKWHEWKDSPSEFGHWYGSGFNYDWVLLKIEHLEK